MRIVIRVVILLGAFLAIASQADEPMPDHDITLLSISFDSISFAATNPVIVANQKGYDNQPYFKDNNSLYYTHMEDVNADIWFWHSGNRKRLTSTLESEYSPTVMPFNSEAFSTVRVEQDNTQRLWQINSDGSFELLFSTIKPVGYHAWHNENIVMFILGEPHRLEYARFGEESSTVVDSDIGRCLAVIPGTSLFSYTRKAGEIHQLHSYNAETGEKQTLTTLPAESEDYVWWNDEIILSSDGAQILWKKIKDEQWKLVRLPAEVKFKGISRMALSPDRNSLAIVHLKTVNSF